MRNLFYLIVCVLLLASFAFSANTDRFYQGTVTIEETFTTLQYKWVYTVPTVATDQMHSPAMFIGDANDNDGMITAVVSAASDVNIIYHYGDGVSWYTAVTPSDLDATSSTTKVDTIGIQDGTTQYAFDVGKWLIIEADYGSAACEAGEVVTIVITLRKDKYFMDSSGRMVTCGQVKKTRTIGWTNP